MVGLYLKPMFYAVAMASLKLPLDVYFLWCGFSLGTLWCVNMEICIHSVAGTTESSEMDGMRPDN